MAAGLNSVPGVRVFQNSEALSRAVAERFVEIASERGASGKPWSVALSGGATPRHFYSLLKTDVYRTRIDWTAMHVFWADERCVPPDDNDSNYKLARDLLLSGVPIPDSHIHRVHGEEEPEEAARRYDSDIRAFFGDHRVPVFDLVILGAGADGHTASLFPGSEALQEQPRIAIPVFLKPPERNRVSLALQTLNNAGHVLVLAAGYTKAGVIHEIFENGNAGQLPAGLVRPVNGSVEWFIDQEAAARSESIR